MINANFRVQIWQGLCGGMHVLCIMYTVGIGPHLVSDISHSRTNLLALFCIFFTLPILHLASLDLRREVSLRVFRRGRFPEGREASKVL
jgi:hypothetical protein